VVLAAWYMLRMYQGPMQGTVIGNRRWPDLAPREWVPLVPLLAVMLAIGVYPKPLPDLIGPSVAALAKALGT
jgi:NADH-quinone oxidoreductase subunit M